MKRNGKTNSYLHNWIKMIAYSTIFLRANNGCHCSKQMHLPIRMRFETRNTLSKNHCAYAIDFWWNLSNDSVFWCIRVCSFCHQNADYQQRIMWHSKNPKLCTDALHTCLYSILVFISPAEWMQHSFQVLNWTKTWLLCSRTTAKKISFQRIVTVMQKYAAGSFFPSTPFVIFASLYRRCIDVSIFCFAHQMIAHLKKEWLKLIVFAFAQYGFRVHRATHLRYVGQ